MEDQPLVSAEAAAPSSRFTKGQPLFTKNALGEMVSCTYEHEVKFQEDCHSVKISEGEYQGICYKSKEELFTIRPNS